MNRAMKGRGAGGRPTAKDERRTAMVAFRTTGSLKSLASRLARSENRSLANYLEHLVWNGCRESLSRAASYQPTEEDKIAAMKVDVA